MIFRPALSCQYLFLAACAVASLAIAQGSPAIKEAELVRRTQQLYDAMPPGDQMPWKSYYAEDAMVYDEKGRAMNKKALLDDLQPMPTGYSGVIKVVHPHATFAPGVAVLAYDCDETETIFGQELHARYHSVDTWLYRVGRWQIAAAQTMRYYEDPALGFTDPAHLNDFIGVYELAVDNRRTVTRDGNGIFLQRGTGAETKLLPESGDLFFRAGVEGRILFHRNESGKVVALYDRRNNEDVIWRKLP
ncbi:MAG: DUF4440 domain-containing protein [Terracidiphilus sp.]